MKKYLFITSALISLVLVGWNVVNSKYAIVKIMNCGIEALSYNDPNYVHKMKPKISVFTADKKDASIAERKYYGDYEEESIVNAEISNIESPYIHIFYDCIGAIFNYKVCDINRVGWQNPYNYVN